MGWRMKRYGPPVTSSWPSLKVIGIPQFLPRWSLAHTASANPARHRMRPALAPVELTVADARAKKARLPGKRTSATITASARMRMPASHRKDLRRTFFLTPMAEIHQYAINSNHAMARTERTGIRFFLNPGVDPFKLTQATVGKFRRGIVGKANRPNQTIGC